MEQEKVLFAMVWETPQYQVALEYYDRNDPAFQSRSWHHNPMGHLNICTSASEKKPVLVGEMPLGTWPEETGESRITDQGGLWFGLVEVDQTNPKGPQWVIDTPENHYDWRLYRHREDPYVGYIYVTGDELRKRYGSSANDLRTRKFATDVLTNEVERFNDERHGRVYTLHASGRGFETHDSGPYFGDEWASVEALRKLPVEMRHSMQITPELLRFNPLKEDCKAALFTIEYFKIAQSLRPQPLDASEKKALQRLDVLETEYLRRENKRAPIELLSWAEEIRERRTTTPLADFDWIINKDNFDLRCMGVRTQVDAQYTHFEKVFNDTMHADAEKEIARQLVNDKPEAAQSAVNR